MARAAPFTAGMDQLEAVAVDRSEEGGLSPEAVAPIMRGGQQTLQSGAVRRAAKEWFVVPLEPAVESSKV